MADENNKIDYHALVDYDIADPAKVLAQNEGKATAANMPFGFSEVEGTRGESAYVFDMGEMYGALVQEGLGTKSLIAQKIYDQTGQSYFASIAQDTVATIINDLISVGATPVVSNAYWSSSSYDWLADRKLTEDFIKGWRTACDKSKVVWGGGETQSLSGIIQAGALELAGSGFGVIKDKSRLVMEKNLKAGDAVILIESSGVHANGISLARKIADNLPGGYQTKLPSGKTYGEALLEPTHIYAKVIEKLFDAGIEIHYLSNITGHGWRKLMRATAEFSYIIEEVPPAGEIFDFTAKHSGNDEREMYGNYNMGAGYAVYLPAEQAQKAQDIISTCGLKSWVAGHVEPGPKQVVIKPKKITYSSESLELR
ncbi:phosphoribosylformylglycinamidine cyclo-ligase [Candidatus Parcubacteria bacterium]|nr:phosphoribosylformylglycinamidine cyclo-ligase [Candidatus Parcubacteria bacterium]